MSSDSDPESSGNPVFLFLMIAALLAAWGLIVDVLHTARGGSIDLRNRVTGVRVAADHRDPYSYKWSPADGEGYQDPFNAPDSPVSHTTVTPMTLAAFLPFKNLNYHLTQWLWLLVEYGSLSAGFYAWAHGTAREHWLWGGLLTCLYCLTPHWRLHVDRGQSYVVYAALFLMMFRFARLQGKKGPWLEGLTGSLLTLLRPTFGLTLGIGVARRGRRGIIAAGAGLILWAVLPVLLAGTAIWRNYFHAMSVQARIYLDHQTFAPARFAAKDSIEGIPIDHFWNLPRIPFADTSIYKLISFQLPPHLLLGGWAVLAALAGMVFIRRRETAAPRFWWAVSAWLLIGDYLLPAYRYNYNHILLWPMLLLGLNALTGRASTVWRSVSAGLLALHAATWFLPNACIPWPGIASLALAVGVALFSLSPVRPVKEIPAGAPA